MLHVLQKIDKKLSAQLSSELEMMLLEENASISNFILKLIWLLFGCFMIAKLIFQGMIPTAFIIVFFVYLLIISVAFFYKLFQIGGVISCVGATSLFLIQFFFLPINHYLTLVEGASLLVLGSQVFYNRRMLIIWSSSSLLFFLIGAVYLLKRQGSLDAWLGLIDYLLCWVATVCICWMFLKRTLDIFHRLLAAKAELMIDPLTSTYNRMYFQEEIKRIEKSIPSSILSTLVLDLDKFKEINDTHGHPVGDKILIHFSSIIQKNIRLEDKLVRIGGEEFLLLIWHDGNLDINEYSNRLCKAVHDNPYVLDGREKIPTTCSIGGTTFQPVSEGIQNCIHRADMALYQAKKMGRNQSVIM